MKKSLLLAAVLLFCSGCQDIEATVSPAISADSEESASLAVFTDCSSRKEASSLAGFEFGFPDEIDGYPYQTVRAAENNMVEIVYRTANRDDSSSIMVRKAFGSMEISGQTKDYPENQDLEINSCQVSARGQEGKIFCASWSNDGFTYSVVSSLGLENDQLTTIVSQIQ